MMSGIEVIFGVKAMLWMAAAVSAGRRGWTALGVITACIAALHGVAIVDQMRPSALALLVGAGGHLLVGLPDGRLRRGGRRAAVGVTWVLSALVAIAVGADLVDVRIAVPALAAVALTIVIAPAVNRYQRAPGSVRQRMQWVGWAITVAGGVAGVSFALGVLIGWPESWWFVASASTALVPIAILASTWPAVSARIDRLLVRTVSIAGLTIVVFVSYVAIVVGLGRIPTGAERTIIGLSMGAAAVAAIFYVPARERLASIANRIVYGDRHAPDEVLRTFGTRLSRAIPMDELLLQLAEGLRKTFSLQIAEIWTGSDGMFERTISDPEYPVLRLHIGDKELPIVARAGVSGPAWLKVWLPHLLAGREESMVRMAPITHSGELLGMIVVQRADPDDPLGDENERVLAELARQVALALHNVQLDSALQASLEELKRHAEDLRRSRQRIVAVGDAERRKIERNLHDGAQQHLVALKVKLRLAQRVASDPDAIVAMLGQLGEDVQVTIEELRALSHGIFPPVLVDRGLTAALEAAAGRATLPTVVDGDGVARYRPEIETAVYFCCLEALQNAGKHAGEEARVRITLRSEDEALVFEVADDGAGFDAQGKGLGAGFTNMTDRIGAVGGTVAVESAPGAGTRVSGRIPVS